jgi:hypothetical protein
MALSFRPWRNPLCRRYEQCFEPAAKRNWLLSCHECLWQHAFSFESNMTGERALLLRIFYQNLYRALNVKNQHCHNSVLNKLHDISQQERLN